jgi:hypothetical protein
MTTYNCLFTKLLLKCSDEAHRIEHSAINHLIKFILLLVKNRKIGKLKWFSVKQKKISCFEMLWFSCVYVCVYVCVYGGFLVKVSKLVKSQNMFKLKVKIFKILCFL